MDGSDKLVPFTIGKSKKTRVFNGVKELPVKYDSSNNAWMTTLLFNKWIDDLNSRMMIMKKKFCYLLTILVVMV